MTTEQARQEEAKFDITAKNHIPIFDDTFYEGKPNPLSTDESSSLLPKVKEQQFKYDNLHDAKEILEQFKKK